MKRRPLQFHAFTMNCVSFINHGLWKHPSGRHLDYTDLNEWVELAKLVERARFDTLFFADTVGVYEGYRGGRDVTVREAVQIPNGDPSVLIPALAQATEHLGFAFTSSVQQAHPFEFARRVSTLDHLTGGRVAWNIVTSFQPSAARNFNSASKVALEDRYVWAEEYMDVVYKLWEGSWEDGAVLRDTERGVYADPARVHSIDHVGARYRVAGPHLAEPSPQRTPVLFQAGSSEAGRRFAGRHAEGTFIIVPEPSSAAVAVSKVRAQAVAAGRDPADVKFVQGLSLVIGSTEEEARRLDAEYEEYLSDEGFLAHVSGNVGRDFSIIDPKTPLTEVVKQDVNMEGVFRAMLEGAPPGARTWGDMAKLLVSTRVVGTPEQIADELERWADAGVDGFNVTVVITPGTFADFGEHLTPVLQERGLMRAEYAPGTLREKLGGEGPRLPERHPAAQFRKL